MLLAKPAKAMQDSPNIFRLVRSVDVGLIFLLSRLASYYFFFHEPR